MTIEQLEIIHWLNGAFYADKKLQALKAQRDRLRTLSQHITVCYGGNGKGKSDGRSNNTENALMKLAEINEQIDNEINNLMQMYSKIDAAINCIDDDIAQVIFRRRYLAFQTIEKIAEEMHYSTRNIKYIHKKNLEKIAPFCIVLHPKK